MDFEALQRNYNPNSFRLPVQQPQPEQRKKPGGLRGALLNFLPTIAGGAGAVIGTLGGPVGTLAGGAVGSGLGEILRQKLSGENTNLATVAREGAFGALPGIGKGVSALRAARAAKNVPQVAQTTETVMQARKGLTGRAQSSAQLASQEGMGLTVGQSVGRGKILEPDDATRIQDFITNRSQQYGGIRPGKPIDQARDAQNVLNNVTSSLDDSLTKINRAVDPTEISTINQSIMQKVAANALITGKSSTTAQKLMQKVEQAPDLKTLEQVRREADNIAFTQSGAKKTSAAAQAKDVRDAIDEFITPLSPEYKAIKGDYSLARDALESTSKANKNAKGFKIPFIGVEVGKQSVPGIKNRVAAKVAGTTPTAQKPGFRPFMGQVARASVPQAGYRVAGSALLGTPFVGSGGTETPSEPQSTTAPITQQQTPQQTAPTQTYSLENLQADIQRDPANAEEYLKIYEGLQSAMASSKPLSAEAAKVVSNAQTGIQALQDFEGLIQSSPDAFARTNIPGVGTLDRLTAGRASGALGTSSLNAARQQIIDVIARLRTGAAITNDEAARFEGFVPQPGDPPEARQQKMNYLMNQFQMVANRSGSAGTDLQAATGF